MICAGLWVESAWDITNITIGIGSLIDNIKSGAWGNAGVDPIGVVIDVGATILPGMPGGAGTIISIGRLERKIPVQDFSTLPDCTKELIEYIAKHNGNTKPCLKGNKIFRNSDEKLPLNTKEGQPIVYKEYDINPASPEGGRDANRVVIGSDGRMYITHDHYASFVEIQR